MESSLESARRGTLRQFSSGSEGHPARRGFWFTVSGDLLASARYDAVLHRLHELFRVGEVGLCDADLLLEVVNHVFMQPNFGRFLGDAHLVDLVLQPQQSIEEIFWPWRAAHDVNVHRDDA